MEWVNLFSAYYCFHENDHISYITKKNPKNETFGSILVKSFQPTAVLHIETSHFIYAVSQMTGFYMKCSNGLKWVNLHANLQQL